MFFTFNKIMSVKDIHHNSDKLPSNLRFSNHYFWLRTDTVGTILETNNKFKDNFFSSNKTMIDLMMDQLFHPIDLLNYQFLLQKNLKELKRCFFVDLRTRSISTNIEILISWEFQISFSDDGEVEIFGIGHPTIETSKVPINEVEENPLSLKSHNFPDTKVVGWCSVDSSDLETFQIVYLSEELDLETANSNFINWRSIVHKEDWDVVEKCLHSLMVKPALHNSQCSFRIYTKKREYRWIKGFWTLQQVLDRVSANCCLIDITENKYAQNLLEQQHQLLQNIIFEQSHTMRSKLTNIIGALALINPKILQEENATYIKIIKKEAEKLDGLIKDSVTNSSFLLK
jgi:hypothetical protein